MNRKDFLSAVGSLVTLPLTAIPSHRSFRVPKTFAVCFGESGCRIWSHLVHYGTDAALLPMIVEKEQSVLTLFRPLGQRKVVIVSRLDDSILTKALPLLERHGGERKVMVTGYFVHPLYGRENLSGNIIANCNLRKCYEVFDHIRVVNLPDYAEGDIRPRWRLRWLDKEMNYSEKQIVWEILSNEQRTITNHKKGATP